MRESFDGVFLIQEGVPLLLATRADLSIDDVRARLVNGRTPDGQAVLDRGLRTLVDAPDGEEWPVLTDDRNDIELRAFARRGL